jgi:hypothetical protein
MVSATLSQTIESSAWAQSRGRASNPRSSFENAAVSCLVVSAILVVAISSSYRFHHWFLAPIAVCGVIIGVDAVAWMRGSVDVFDPAGLVGMIGFHFFFLAPLLHVHWDMWIQEVAPPSDWRDWLGYMGLLNGIGLVLYRVARASVPQSLSRRQSILRIEEPRFRVVSISAILASTVVQLWVYAQAGGVAGYMRKRMEPSGFEGMGWIFMISETAPILVAIMCAFYATRRRNKSALVASALILPLVMQILFGGLRGSRSETVQLLFWAVGCIHCVIRPVPRTYIYCGCIVMMLFLYMYGFYKALGVEAKDAILYSDRQQLENRTGRTGRALLLGDLGRADVQAFVLYRLKSYDQDFQLAHGRTYIGALALMIPHSLLPERPETKLKEGTEIQSTTGAYVPRVWWSSRVYGIAGEAMLNFGAMGVPIAYGAFGLIIALIQRYGYHLHRSDARCYLLPFTIYLAVNCLSGDSDNLIFGIVKSGVVPSMVLLSSSCLLRTGSVANES